MWTTQHYPDVLRLDLPDPETLRLYTARFSGGGLANAEVICARGDCSVQRKIDWMN